MLSNRKWAFMLSALMIAGVGLSGCDEQNWTCEECVVVDPDESGSGTTQNDFRSMASFTNDELKKQSECTGSAACLSSSKCKDGAAYVACLCVSSTSVCHELPSCNGVGSCKAYTCGESAETCGYSACAGSPECQGPALIEKITCQAALMCDEEAASICEDVAKLNPKQDFDGDGLTNEEELSHPQHPHPCFADSDADGADDKREVNAGSDPMNPASKPAGNDALRTLICTHEALSQTEWTEVLKDMNIAKLSGATYQNTASKLVSVFGHDTNHVYGFFGSKQKTNGAQLLKAAGLTAGTYIEEAKFSSTIPLASWTGYKHDLQIVPDSEEVNRYKFTITLEEGQTVQDLQNKIAKVFDSAAPKLSGSDTCASSGGKVSLYLARSSYTKDGNTERIYGGAMACANYLTEKKQTLFMLEDVLSGTLVSPNISIANISGDLFPYQTNHCQVGTVLSSGYVDFIWVVDNSGSMEDELDSVAATVENFTQRLGSSGITYRVAVTYTDAYLVDERLEPNGLNQKIANHNYYTFYDENGGYSQNSYMTGLGFRNYEISNRGAAAFLSTANLVKSRVPAAVKNYKNCGNSPNATNPNICGFGYEDGLKSGLVALQRLSLDPAGSKPDWIETDEEFDFLKKIKTSIITKLGNKDADVKFDDANKALKYIIWVSDEESRQFKEAADYSDADVSKAVCKTGYKLNGNKMRMGSLTTEDDGKAAEVCNPSIKDVLDQKVEGNFAEAAADASKTLFQDMSLEEIKAFDSDYYNVLRYYLDQYQKFAGEGGITGFALVGDSGNKNGGVCSTLQVCDGICYKSASDEVGTQGSAQVGCFDCKEVEGKGWRDDPAAVIGANYGLSYIHLARFLGTEVSEDGGKIVTKGKEGGFASICNSSFDVSVDAIFEDVAGRVASKYQLEGYPISSTIRVGAMRNGTAFELERGASTNGWTYDASQNAVIFTSLQVDNNSDLAISYDLWKVKEG